MRVAALDLGTNSTRLLVAEVTDPDRPPRVLAREMAITRLGEGVDAERRLRPGAIARTREAVARYRSVIDGLGGVARVRAVATSAARDARNRDELFAAVETELGVRPEVLTGRVEAELSFRGATADLPPGLAAPYLVVDIGGGSTEFVVGTDRPLGAVSIDVGCVRITEQWLHGDPPRPEELSQAISVVREHLTDVVRELPEVRAAATLIGLAGTVTTMAAVEIGLPVYDRERIHHFRLGRAAAEDVFRTLATEAAVDRAHNPGLEPGRVDVIVGGALVLVTVMRTLGFAEVLVSEADILDGIALDLAATTA